jgi:uncharacterized membrane protein YccC
MLKASLLVGIAVWAGGVSGRTTPVAVVVVTVWAFAAGMMAALSAAAADIGLISLVTLTVFAANPTTWQKAVFAGLLALSGGLLQTALALAFWPLRRYVPERRALANLYTELSRTAASTVLAAAAPPASAESTEAQDALATLQAGYSIEAERHLLLLSQAERMRLSLLALARFRTRLQREDPSAAEINVLDRYLRICSQMLASLAESLLNGGAPLTELPDLQASADELRALEAGRSLHLAALERATLRDARHQMDALAGQLRSAVDLAASATPQGLVAFRRHEGRTPWRLRLGGTVATLRANLSLDSAVCRHAIRLSACIAIGDGLARAFDLHRSYWVPMTIAIVLKPDFASTFSRGVLRLAGTFAGLAFSTAVFHVLPPSIGLHVALLAALMFILKCFGPANYGILVTVVTALVVVMLAITGVSPKEVMAARGFNTATGGALALAAYWLWPTWERSHVPAAMAKVLNAYGAYFNAVRRRYEHPQAAAAGELDRTRLAARLARSNAEASLDRVRAEPGTSANRMRALDAILASSHRLVHAMMALEAGLSTSHPAPARAAFRPFCQAVELTLDSLAQVLRGSLFTAVDWPDLRELHHALVHSGDSLADRYALVNVETDRITNSLNTLSAAVRRWTGAESEPSSQPA